MSTSSAAPAAFKSEVRFAVVMYGGVSLAIYINGVTQELFSLVKSTWRPGSGPTSLKPTLTEGIYRKVAWLLADKSRKLSDCPAQVTEADVEVRFVIDILSGTSAGGINAVFLAKALSQGAAIDSLMDLWIQEADIARLINDSKSLESGLLAQKTIESLLNGERLYLEVLKALVKMDPTTPDPMVKEVDLFVTSTDLEGLLVPLQISDQVVFERSHRNVFHFKFDSDDAGPAALKDFDQEANPFLAFAARCTSSFPFAFEPMMLKDILRCGITEEKLDKWGRFFKNYDLGTLPGTKEERKNTDFKVRVYGDGGYLDNKPFGHAIDILGQKDADVPVVRKLIYIEPSPEHPEQVQQAREAARNAGEAVGKPNVLESVAKATVLLPGYETIRQDLERILERNRIIEEVVRNTANIEKDVESSPKTAEYSRDEAGEAEKWSKMDLKQMIELYGPLYGGYHRLRVLDLTDRYSRFLTTIAGFNPDSHHFLAVRSIVSNWRSFVYRDYDPDNSSVGMGPMNSENKFLYDFDLLWWQRRIKFVLNKADLLFALDPKETLAQPSLDPAARRARKLLRSCFQKSPEQGEIYGDAAVALKDRISKLKKELAPVFKKLRGDIKDLWADRLGVVRGLIAKTGIHPAELNEILQKQADGKSSDVDFARKEHRPRFDVLQEIAAHLREQVTFSVTAAVQEINRILPVEGNGLAERCLRHFYRRFYDYDMVLFPLQYRTDIGEGGAVDVVRISPEDANDLLDGKTRKKLAGTVLFNFGAFLEKEWRLNDLLWGRLDGAERLIEALLPGDSYRDARTALIKEAHDSILKSSMDGEGKNALCRLMGVVETVEGASEPTAVKRLAERIKSMNGDLEKGLLSCLEPEALRNYYQKDFEAPKDLNPKETVHNIARMTRVTGKMLEEVSDRAGTGQGATATVSKIARIFWGMVEVATPRSVKELLFNYAVYIVYLIAVVIVALGYILKLDPVLRFGLAFFGVTMLSHGIVLQLNRYMKGLPVYFDVVRKIVIGGIFVAIFGLFGLSLVGLVRNPGTWWKAVMESEASKAEKK